MKRFAQIYKDTVHWIFEAEEKPEFHPSILILDITDVTPIPQERWSYDKDSNTFSEEPIVVVTLEESKEAKIAEILLASKNELVAGFDCSPFGDDVVHHYAYDDEAQKKFEKMFTVQSSPLAQPTVKWTTSLELQKVHTAEQFMQVCGVAFLLEMTNEHKKELIDSLINACETIEGLDVITWGMQLS